MLAHRIAFDRGETTARITEFAGRLADEASTGSRTFDTTDVFRAETKHAMLAMVEEVVRGLEAYARAEEEPRRVRGREIHRRLEVGESLDDLLRDPDLPFKDFEAIREHQERGTPIFASKSVPGADDWTQRRQAAIHWIATGMSLAFGHDAPEAVNRNRAARLNLLPRSTQPKRRRKGGWS